MRKHALGIGLVALCGVGVFTLGGGCGGVVDEAAAKQFHQKLGNTSITVFPAFVRDGTNKRYDAAAAQSIAKLLTEQKLATPTVSTAEVPINSPWGMNESKMFRESVADFEAYVAKNPIKTDYALLPEYLIGSNGVVGGVHLYLLDAQGTPAYGIGLNSHHKAFNDVNPKTVDDCTRIVVNVLRSELKTPSGG